jgi:hypothetical protein
MRDPVRRAQPARPPALSEQERHRESTGKKNLRARVLLEQRSLLRGLILLAVIILIVSLARAGFGRLFVPGWWRQW